jgi:hypothetical protein
MPNDDHQTDVPPVPPEKKMRFRAHDWINTVTFQPIYSIQASVGSSTKWSHVARAGEPLFFDKAAERDVVLAELIAMAEVRALAERT